MNGKRLPEVSRMEAWCETCATGSSERIARDVFEQMFSTPFPKRRPKWLINSRGHQMELDGYSKTLSLGFEYQGIQHYKETMSFHRGGQNVARQKRNDTRKQKLCRSHGVNLIAIPYTVIPADMPAYIFRTVKKRGLKLSMRQQKTIKVAQVSYCQRSFVRCKTSRRNTAGRVSRARISTRQRSFVGSVRRDTSERPDRAM